MDEPWKAQVEALGAFIRSQRQLAKLSLRDLADRTNVSNPYLSQLERGLHEPSIRVLQAIAKALDLSAETLLSAAGIIDESDESDEPGATKRPPETVTAILADDALTDEQKQALLAVYRGFLSTD